MKNQSKDTLPPSGLYSKYLQIAATRFRMTIDECRDKYGLYTEAQWEALFDAPQPEAVQADNTDDIPFKSETVEYNNAVENKAKNLYGNKFHSVSDDGVVSELTKYGETIATFNPAADDVLIRNMLNAYPALQQENQRLKDALQPLRDIANEYLLRLQKEQMTEVATMSRVEEIKRITHVLNSVKS